MSLASESAMLGQHTWSLPEVCWAIKAKQAHKHRRGRPIVPMAVVLHAGSESHSELTHYVKFIQQLQTQLTAPLRFQMAVYVDSHHWLGLDWRITPARVQVFILDSVQTSHKKRVKSTIAKALPDCQFLSISILRFNQADNFSCSRFTIYTLDVAQRIDLWRLVDTAKFESSLDIAISLQKNPAFVKLLYPIQITKMLAWCGSQILTSIQSGTEKAGDAGYIQYKTQRYKAHTAQMEQPYSEAAAIKKRLQYSEVVAMAPLQAMVFQEDYQPQTLCQAINDGDYLVVLMCLHKQITIESTLLIAIAKKNVELLAKLLSFNQSIHLHSPIADNGDTLLVTLIKTNDKFFVNKILQNKSLCIKRQAAHAASSIHLSAMIAIINKNKSLFECVLKSGNDCLHNAYYGDCKLLHGHTILSLAKFSGFEKSLQKVLEAYRWFHVTKCQKNLTQDLALLTSYKQLKSLRTLRPKLSAFFGLFNRVLDETPDKRNTSKVLKRIESGKIYCYKQVKRYIQRHPTCTAAELIKSKNYEETFSSYRQTS